MNFQSFISTPEFNQLHPVKQQIIKELANNRNMSSPEAMLPQLMSINKELKKRNLSFTKQETTLLINLMKSDMSPAEQKKVDVLLGLFQI
ncbi:MAG: hypothetical protein ACI4F4_11145 [Lachnospiraceae bacterium]